MLQALFDGDFDTYFKTARTADALWLFVHVPKTAGSSLTAEAEAILRPSFNIDIDHADNTASYQAKFDDAVADFINRVRTEKFRFATGHISARHLPSIRAAVPEVRCATMLRDPIARIISDYRYQRSAMNAGRLEFMATTPDFDAYVSRPYVHNKMALSLVPRPIALSGDVDGCVDRMMRDFAFVGLQENFGLSVHLLTALMGSCRIPVARVRVNDCNSDKLELSTAQMAALRQLNATDIGIYNAFEMRYRRIAGELTDALTSLSAAWR